MSAKDKGLLDTIREQLIRLISADDIPGLELGLVGITEVISI